VSFGFGKSLIYRTTGISLALFLVSRFYRNCYSVQSSLTPFLRLGKRSALAYDIQLLKCFLVSSFIIQQKERKLNFKMNLYFRDIICGTFEEKKDKALLLYRVRGLSMQLVSISTSLFVADEES